MADYKNCNGLNGSRWLKEKIFFVINLLYQYWNFKDIISTFDCCFMYKLMYNTYCSTVENAPNCCTVNKNALKLLQMLRYLMYYHQWHKTEVMQKILVVHQNGYFQVFLFLSLNFLSSDLGKYNDGNKNPTLYIIIFINVFEIVLKYTNAGPLLRCFFTSQ